MSWWLSYEDDNTENILEQHEHDPEWILLPEGEWQNLDDWVYIPSLPKCEHWLFTWGDWHLTEDDEWEECA